MKKRFQSLNVNSFEIRLLCEILIAVILLVLIKGIGESNDLLKLVFPVLFWGFIVGYFIVVYFNSFTNFLRKHWRYFWPSFLYLLILGGFLLSVDQVDTLFVDLFEGNKWSLFLFIFFQFPCSILIVWYIPFYLFFSKNYYNPSGGRVSDNNASNPQRYFLSEKIIYYFHLFLPVKTLIVMSGKEPKDAVNRNKEYLIFHQVRRLLGSFYIVTLIFLLGSILEKVGFSSSWKWGALGGAWGIMIVFYWSLLRIEKNKETFKRRGQRKFSLRNSYTIPLVVLAILGAFSFSGIFQFSPWLNAYNITLLILFGAFIILLILLNKKINTSEKNADLITDVEAEEGVVEEAGIEDNANSAYLKRHGFIIFLSIILLSLFGLSWLIYIFFSKGVNVWLNIKFYLVANLIFLFVFMGFAYYRRFTRTYEFPENSYLNRIFSFLDDAITPFMMLTNFLLSSIFVASFFGGLFCFSSIIADHSHLFNPINIFFFSFNGLVALFALGSRALTLSTYYKQNKDKLPEEPDEKAETPGVRRYWYAGVFILFTAGLYFYSNGTSYHTLKYVAAKDNNPLSLQQYTKQFLESRDSTKPIILIASDGGGLKGAYWTLLVLEQLEKEGKLNFKEDVFLTSGASGGSIGLGMYTYLKGQPNYSRDASLLSHTIDKIGQTNFLSTDFVGSLSRWPLKGIPIDNVQNLPDRMDVMARNYFKISDTTATWKYEDIKDQPFSYLWEKNQYKLPIFVANTAQMEYGMKGFTHPLKTNPVLTKGYIDLTIDNEGTYITFPDALFTTNRFPVLSPMAKVEGHGHFFDAGALDNSGVGTILQFLQYMKASTDSVYREFFNHDIKLISIRCAKSRYIFDNFHAYHEDIPLTKSISYIKALLSGVSNDGLTGTPRFYDKLLDESTWRNYYNIEDFEKISLPFYINDELEVCDVLGGSIEDAKTQQTILNRIDELNLRINKKYDMDDLKQRPKALDPPLGRMISKTSRDYMRKMSEVVVN